MTTSPKTLLISAISDDAPLLPAQCAYFRGRFRARIHEVILNTFIEMKADGFTKADLARRLGKAPEQVTRWLAAPGNLRVDTISDLLLAMKRELDFSVHQIDLQVKHNEFHELAPMKPIIATTSANITINIKKSPVITQTETFNAN